jgi:hypothetical protein
VSVQTQPVGQRPQFTVVDEEHPLGVEQRNGITMERVEEIAEMMLHPERLVLPDGPPARSAVTS